jgi:hypothetical protein
MISRVTLFSFLFCLLLGVGIRRWSLTHPDNCDRYLAGEKKLPPREYVISGTRQIAVPCNQWLIRQPERVQILCLADLLLAATFAVNAVGDLQSTRRARAARRQAR